MDLEARSLQPNLKSSLLIKLKEHKSDLNNIKTEVKRITNGTLNAAARDELLEAGMADTKTASADQRSRLLMSTESLYRTSDKIKDCQRTAMDSEEIGVSTLQNVQSQTQSLLGTHKKLHGVDANIEKIKKILTGMMRMMNKNKWTTGAIITALIAATILILYFRLSK